MTAQGFGNPPRVARRRADVRRRGTVLIVTIWIVLVLAGMVVMLARAMRVEATCSANETSALQAQAIEQGAIQYVLANLDSLNGALPTDDETLYQAIRVGNGVFWVIRPDTDDCTVHSYGLVPEASKVNLNTASLDTLLLLPDMTDELAACIVDWRSPTDTASPNGAKSEYYMLLEDPYQCKEAPLETVEELFLVKGATKEVLFGMDYNRNGVMDAGEDGGSGQLDRGLANFVTVYSSEPAAAAGAATSGNSGGNTSARPGAAAPATTPRGLINVATAPREVLLTLPGLVDSDADAIVSARTGSNVDTTNNAWLVQAIGAAKAAAIASVITAKAYQFSADIVSLSGDGRAFRRCRIVVDNQTSPPQILYRQDLTRLGWPLDEAIRDHVRSGGGVDDLAAGVVTQEKS